MLLPVGFSTEQMYKSLLFLAGGKSFPPFQW
jgi:hypothetical protein